MFQPVIPLAAGMEVLREAPAEGSFEVRTEEEARNLATIGLGRFQIKKEIVIDVAHAKTDLAIKPAPL